MPIPKGIYPPWTIYKSCVMKIPSMGLDPL
jgi:hypothetical protein